MTRILKNVFFQGIYQFLTIFVSIVTVPIVSRALGADQLGIFNYTNSVINYLVLAAGLGLANYGIREISAHRDNKETLRKTFWELETFNIFIGMFVVVVFLFISLFIEYRMIFLLQGLTLLGALTDISWFFTGMEDFKKLTVRNTLVKLFSLIMIVAFIHGHQDLWKYVLIISLSNVVPQLVMWPIVLREVGKFTLMPKGVTHHLKPAMEYFISKIAISIYTNINKTLLGLLSTTVVVGLFSNGILVVNMLIGIIGALDTVLFPRVTNLLAKKEDSKVLALIENAVLVQVLLTIPMTVGLIAISTIFVPVFFGAEFVQLERYLPLMSILIIIIPLGTLLVKMYFMPMSQMKAFNVSVIVGAVIGVILNIVLIPFWGIYGAIWSTVIAELFVTILRIIHLARYTRIKVKTVEVIKYIFASFVMFVVTKLFVNTMAKSLPQIVALITAILIAILVYSVSLVVLRVKYKPLVATFKD